MYEKIELTDEEKRECLTKVTDDQVVHNPYTAVAELALELKQCSEEKTAVVEKVEQQNQKAEKPR